MTTLRRRTFWLLAFFSAGLGSSIFLNGQVPAPAIAQQPDAAAAVAPGSPPIPPISKSPVESFRELLAMPAAGREKFLATRPPELRERLQAKIREYEAMNPDKREAALGATQLYWYLEQFIQTPATNLDARLAAVPEPYRKIVTDRVRQFYVLPPPLQAEVLEHRTTSSYFLGQNSDAPAPAPASAAPFPPLPQPLAELSRLPVAQRRDVYADFQHFFELTDADRQKVLHTLPEAQQQQVAKLLQILERLPAPQRAQGLQSISKLAGMTDEQQQQFFRNAARWQGISPEERQSWLRLVNQLPPLPPGAIMPPLPPFPPTGARGRLGPAVATNNNEP